MKKLVSRIFTPFLAALVLLSTISWSVDKHLCMGRVMDIAFFHKADDCGMEAAMKLLNNTEENHCCDDESFTIEGQDDLKLSWNDFSVEQQYFLAALSITFFNPQLELSERPIPNAIYPPPKLVNDIRVLHQVFLI